MEEERTYINLRLKAEQVIYAFTESLKSYNKLRLKGRGTRAQHYLINVPQLYIGEKYAPNKRYSVSFGMNKKNNHQLVVIDLDDQATLKAPRNAFKN